jgi:L-fuconolactonase
LTLGTSDHPNLVTALMLFAFVFLGVWMPAADPKSAAVTDTHVHLWDITRKDGLGWIAADNTVLNKSFLPKDHAAQALAAGVTAVVVVQAGQHLPDNQWNLDITAADKALYKGVVGNLSKVVGTDDFAPLLEKLCQDKRYVGYRLSGRTTKTITDELIRDLKATAKAGRIVDVLAGEYSLADVNEISRRVPELKIILDHFGNVVLNDKPLDAEWVKSFRGVAANRNVHCKVSALYGRVKAQPAPKDLAFYTPILDLAFDAFGEDRLVFGSDWPVSEQTADYAATVALVKAYVEAKGPAVAAKVLRTNAAAFYGLDEDVPRPSGRD